MGMVASAPRVDMGPGLPATTCRKCRTATSHDELPRALLHRVKRCSVPVRKDGCDHFFSVYTKRKQEVRTCRDVPCSNSSCQSKKAKVTLPILDNASETKQSERSAQQRRCGECARVFRVAFCRKLSRARLARVSALFGLLKACESSLKKPSACTTCGAPLLNFREVLRVALAGSEFLRSTNPRSGSFERSRFPEICVAERGGGGGGLVLRLTT
jgi:hypothetical protein